MEDIEVFDVSDKIMYFIASSKEKVPMASAQFVIWIVEAMFFTDYSHSVNS